MPRARWCWVLLAVWGCVDDVDLPPRPPTLAPLESPTRRARITVSGTKPRDTAVLNHEEEVVPRDASESFAFELALVPGVNELSLRTRKASGKLSTKAATATVELEPDFPGPPTLAPVRSPTNARAVRLTGGKQAGTSLELDELPAPLSTPTRTSELVAAGPETTFAVDVTLPDADGTFFFSLVTRDARGRRSEPVDFEVTLDRVAPSLVSQWPAPGATDVPLDVELSIGLDGDLAVNPAAVDQNIVVLESGALRTAASVGWGSLSHAFGVLPGAPLAPSTLYTVRLDAALFTDLAGNAATPAPASFTWTFTTGTAADGAVPAAPTVSTPATTTAGRTAALSGAKPANTSVRVNGLEVVPVTAATTWSFAWPLQVGANDLSVVARSGTGVQSAPATLTVTRQPATPPPPVVSPAPPATTDEPLLVLQGTRAANTTILLNGVVVVPRGPDTSWTCSVELLPGRNDLQLRARSAEGVLSTPVSFSVELGQTFSGLVESGYKLVVTFTLRDLSTVDPVRGSFDTGANQYAVDAWVEGPLTRDEQCTFDAATRERTNIKYVSTIAHYIGTKQSHTNPFLDQDYRAPDYLAALVSGGVFAPTFGPGTDRRDDGTGFQGGALTDTGGRIKLTDQDLRQIDGVTEPTSPAGLKRLEWLPLDRNLQRVQQGEYLVHVAINLDRDPGWVAQNDLETCWGDVGFAARGPHRIVRRLPLGSRPFSVRVGADAELSGPDLELGADGLRYLTPDGITFEWVKP